MSDSTERLVVGTIGPRGQCRRALGDALARAAGGPSPAPAGRPWPAVVYQTATRRYVHLDCPDDLDHPRATLGCFTQLDLALAVLPAGEALAPHAAEQLLLAHQMQVPLIVGVVDTGATADPARVETAADALRAAIEGAGFEPGFPLVRGDIRGALAGAPDALASMTALLATLDAAPSLRYRRDRPLLMWIADVDPTPGGSVVTGRIEQGAVGEGDRLDVLGLGPIRKARVARVERAADGNPLGEPGDVVALTLPDLDPETLCPGMALTTPGTGITHIRLDGWLEIPSDPAWGPIEAIDPGATVQLFHRTAEVPAVLRGGGPLTPGWAGPVRLDLARPLVVHPDERFALRRAGRTIAAGVVQRPRSHQ